MSKTAEEKTTEQYLEDIIASKDARIKELEARLETAEKTIKGIEASCNNEDSSHELIWRIAYDYIDAFLTNKTE